MSEVKQRPMNNEYANVMNWQTVTGDPGWHFEIHSNILSTLQTRNHEVNRQMLLCPLFL